MFKILLSCFISLQVVAQVQVYDEPDTGEKKQADPYFQNRSQHSAPNRQSLESLRYLGLHVGGFVSQEQYDWGTNNGNNVGKINFGLDYLINEWTRSLDLILRADFFTYQLNAGDAVKFSLLPMVIFPNAATQFPLYFGAGAGLGVFLKQIHGSSALSFEYQVIAGLRFFNIWDRVGFNIETGLKNHIHLLSPGQYNSVFLTVGTVFTF